MDRKTKAEELFKAGFNCSQSVIGAFCEDFGLDFGTAMKLSEGFGGGMGRMRLTCGAVSGMVMVVGIMKSDGGKSDTRAEVYETVHTLCDEFTAKNGSLICADLLGLNKKNEYNSAPEARTEEYYKKRPCVECVKDCVELLEKHFKI